MGHQAVRQETSVDGEPVREARTDARSGRHVGDDHIQAAEDHRQHRDDLDDGEPEFEFAELVHAHQVQRGDGDQEHDRRHPFRNVREPVVHERADHGKLHHGDQHIVEPVVPAGDEARALRPVARRIVAERARARILHRHFAQRAHDHENREAADQIGEQDGRSGEAYRFARSIEQAGADGASQGDQLDMAVLQ